MNRVWPTRIRTPHLPLGVSVTEGLAALESTGGKAFEEMDGEVRTLRVNLPEFQMSVYDSNGIVSLVWYDDPAGRLTSFGKRRKIQLYLQRFAMKGKWELRVSNGWLLHFYNDLDQLHMAYGVHMDVIRFNAIGAVGAA